MPIGEMIALSRHPTTMNDDDDIAAVSLRDGTTFAVNVLASTAGHTNRSPIQTWIVQAASMAQAIAMRERERLMSKAFLTGKGFGGTRVRMNGCFGCCPAYEVWFAPSGTATYDAPRTSLSRAIHAAAPIPSARVRAALARSGAIGLEPYYPIRAVDTMGASVDIVVGGRRYTSEGPDSSTWSPEFRSTITRLDQLVVDTHWTPTLPERKP